EHTVRPPVPVPAPGAMVYGRGWGFASPPDTPAGGGTRRRVGRGTRPTARRLRKIAKIPQAKGRRGGGGPGMAVGLGRGGGRRGATLRRQGVDPRPPAPLRLPRPRRRRPRRRRLRAPPRHPRAGRTAGGAGRRAGGARRRRRRRRPA